MEINSTFVTADQTRERAAAAFGLNQKSVFDIVHKDDYKTEAEYIQALAETSKAMETPEYQRARRKAEEEQRHRNEAAIRAEQRKEFQSIRRGVTLTQTEKEQIDRQAADLARRDLAAGRIGASALGATIERYAAELEGKEIDAQASARQFNAFIRREVNRATVNGGQR